MLKNFLTSFIGRSICSIYSRPPSLSPWYAKNAFSKPRLPKNILRCLQKCYQQESPLQRFISRRWFCDLNHYTIMYSLLPNPNPNPTVWPNQAGAFFTTYEAIKSGLSKANSTFGNGNSNLVPQPFIHSAASATAELVSCFILTPAEVLKQNAQMIRKPASSSASKTSTAFAPSVTIQALKQFQRPSQLWRGYTALAARNLPFTAMQFPMFEHLKENTFYIYAGICAVGFVFAWVRIKETKGKNLATFPQKNAQRSCSKTFIHDEQQN